MKRFSILIFVLSCLVFQSCIVTESIILNEDGSGDFKVTYDLSEMGDQMKGLINTPEDENDDIDYDQVEDEKKEGTEYMDTLVYFDDLMIQFKDSIAALPEDEQKALETLKGMYMSMKNDEANGVFEMSIGMSFKSIADLENVQEKVKKAQSVGDGGMTTAAEKGNPLEKLTDAGEGEVYYKMKNNVFSRFTEMPVANELDENKSDQGSSGDNPEVEDMMDGELGDTLQEAFYVIEYTFPRKIKQTSVENAEISEDGKTVSFKVSWAEYLKNPKLLDIDVSLEDE